MRARIADILFHAAKLSGFTVDQIKSKARKRPLIRVRQAIYLIAREQTRPDGEFVVHAHSFPQIGMAMSKDHSTVIHGCEQAAQFVKRDEGFAEFVADLRTATKASAVFADEQKPFKPVASEPPLTLPVGMRPKLKPKPIEMEHCVEAGSQFSLDENGHCLDQRRAIKAQIVGCHRLAAAIHQARAAA